MKRGRPRHPDVLTPREWEVLTLVREGLTNPQIAERMGITLDAAKYHVSEILSKLHLGSREEAAAWQPDPPPTAVLRPSWANALGRWWPLIGGTAGAGVMVAAVVGLGVLAYGVIKSDGEEEPNDATATDPATALFEAEVTELLNGFLEARVAGEGAQQHLNVPEEDIPLLYATSSGAPYERAEFEPVLGIEWPYGFRAFKIRLFAGDTVVEQLFFMPYDDPKHFPADGRPRLEHGGITSDIAPTTEDGQPLAVPYTYYDGEVTLHAAHPWVGGGIYARLIPEGPGVRPTTDGGERSDWDSLWLLADPVPVGTGCRAGPSPADAAALAESIRSDPDLEATAPVAVSAGGAEALMTDVVITDGASVCQYFGRPEALTNEQAELVDIGFETGDRMRLYLFDMPEGSSMRILAIAIVAPESRFESVVEAAAPVVDSVEFHAP